MSIALIKICETCNNEFKVWPNQIRNGRGRFCSRPCLNKWLNGRRFHIAEHKKRKAEKHPLWKGGRYLDSDGYVLILNAKHPFCQIKGTVFEHRIVMEHHLGRYLNSEEVVHHINGIKDDNRIGNLMLFSSHAEHIRYEHRSNKYANQDRRNKQ